ncbi:MAG: cytochrome c family [Geobacteraceae bacterium]|nr:MAG: cytochrome c family [Geobacteraceae bacterium]
MNRSVVNLLVVAMVLMLTPYTVFAQDTHSAGGGYGCGSCHSTHKSLGTLGLYDNTCLSCHKPGSVKQGGRRIQPFSYGDMADPYGTLPDAKYQTSHKWTGPDEVPAAGALPPTNVRLSDTSTPVKAGMLGSISCARCHQINGSKESSVNSAPYLRALNDNDQMCLDCHKPRSTSDVAKGTHPVNINYTSVSKAKPAEYNSRPVNSNPSNPTSAMRLNNGVVLCSTCHGIHYTDSNSRTYDNFSSAVFGRLSTSEGNLLRTDLHGNTAADLNICTNCHRTYDKDANPNGKVANHNGNKLPKKPQNIQCADCHGGHVDYVGANPPANEATPNVYLINRYMNVSSPTGSFRTIRNGKAIIQSTPLAQQNWYKDVNGVCASCHPTLPQSISQHVPSTDTSVCAGCHTHAQGFSASCTGCHGMPPVANVAGGAANGYANSPYNYSASLVFKNESTTPHASHATGTGNYYNFACDECHKGNTHANGQFQQVFIVKTGIIASTGGAIPAYVGTGSGTCNTTYCHSDGAGSYKSPTWALQKDTIINKPGECSACHNLPATSTSHPKHVAGGTTGKSYLCANCHGATVNAANAIIDKTKHVNGTKELAYSGTLGSTSIIGCTSCHNDGKGGAPLIPPQWGVASTGACDACHATNALSTAGHAAHLSLTYGPVLNTQVRPANCQNCHTYTTDVAATHVNGTKEVVYTNCTPCHPNGQPTWVGGQQTTNSWCNSCHTGTLSVIKGITAPNTSLSTTKGHESKAGITGCTTCHDASAAHIIPATKYRLVTALRPNTDINNPCNNCHNNNTPVPVANVKFKNMSTHVTAKGGGQTMECWQCHDLHGTTNNSMIKTKITYLNATTSNWTVSFTNRSTGMVNRVTNRGLCQVCHKTTKYYVKGVPENNHPTGNCFTCHPHNAKGGAFKPAGGCDVCHGYPPVPKSAIRGPASSGPYKGTFGTLNNYTSAKFEDYSGGGGAHLNHVATYAKATDGWSNCNICHDNGNSHRTVTPNSKDWRSGTDGVIGNVTVVLDPRYKFNNTGFIRYSGAKLVNKPAVNKTGSCINVGCHFQPTPSWSNDR